MSESKIQNARKGLPEHADSIKQAAAMLGCSLGVLKAAKAAGCPAFRSTRVYLKELEDWLAEHMPEGGDSGEDIPTKERLEREKLYEQVLTLRLRRAVEEKNYVPTSDVKSDHIRIANAQRVELQRIIADAPTWEGLSAAEIEKRAQALVDAICANLYNSLNPLYS